MDPSDTERRKWRNLKRQRPPEIEIAGPGQESVWDYPRPPRVEAVGARLRVLFGGIALADTRYAYRVIETANPPVYYLPPTGVRMEYLEPGDRESFCEWKGVARYWSVRVGGRIAQHAAWSYPDPDAGFELIRDYIAFYAGQMEACLVAGGRVRPQPGGYYGGWITAAVVGPLKGSPGTEGW